MKAHARSTDPTTSHEAAESVGEGNMYASQQAVLSALPVRGPMTDPEIARQITIHGDGQVHSESRLRTARKELVDKGLSCLDLQNDSGTQQHIPQVCVSVKCASFRSREPHGSADSHHSGFACGSYSFRSIGHGSSGGR